MIYTVTLNPSVDFLVEIGEIIPGTVNWSRKDYKQPGGKGIIVSRVLRRLGIPSTVTGFLGGFTGQFLEDWLQKEDIQTAFTKISDDSRVNIKIMQSVETSIHSHGPNVSPLEIQEFLYDMSQVREGDTVIMAGSIPPTVMPDIYDRIVAICKANKAHFVIDVPPAQLKKYLAMGPLLIRIDQKELAELFQTNLHNLTDCISYGEKCLVMGVKHLIVTSTADGSYLFFDDQIYFCSPIKGKFVNSIGARNAMIAGFIGTMVRTADPVESFRMAVAAGSATSFTRDLATGQEMKALVCQTRIAKIK